MTKEQFIKELTACRKDYDSKQFKQDKQNLDLLIQSERERFLQSKLEDYDVGSLEYQIIESMLKEK